MKENDCIFFKLAKANQLASRFLGQKVTALNITPVQAMILAFLADEDALTSSELGKRTELDSATLTGILDRLEAAGIVERHGNPDDRRSIQIWLTETGRGQAGEVAALIVEANREFLAVLTEGEGRALHDLIGKLRHAVR